MNSHLACGYAALHLGAIDVPLGRDGCQQDLLCARIPSARLFSDLISFLRGVARELLPRRW